MSMMAIILGVCVLTIGGSVVTGMAVLSLLEDVLNAVRPRTRSDCSR